MKLPFPTWRKPTVLALGLLVLAVTLAATLADVRIAAWVLSGGLVVAACLRALAPEHHVLSARSQRFDIAMLLGFAIVLAVLAPWGLADLP